MGRWFRKLWMGLLSGSAALAACNIVAPPPCYYGPPPVDPDNDDTVVKTTDDRREMLRQRISDIRAVLEERSNAEVYGPPEVMEAYAKENRRLQAEADSLENELKGLENE